MNNEKEQNSVLLFSVKNTLYMIPIEHFNFIEIMPKQITEIPNAPYYSPGICRYADETFTLVSLEKLLFKKGSDESNDNLRKIVITVNDLGIIVDWILGIEYTNNFIKSDNNFFQNGKIKNMYTLSPSIINGHQISVKNNAVFELDMAYISNYIKNFKQEDCI